MVEEVEDESSERTRSDQRVTSAGVMGLIIISVRLVPDCTRMR